MLWVIVLKLTIINLAPPELMSDVVFPTQEQCMYAIMNEPKVDLVTCHPLRMAVVKPSQKMPTSRGESKPESGDKVEKE